MKVLLVEDEAVLRDAIKETLANEGFEVVAVASCAAALTALSRDLAVVVTDYHLGEKKGCEVVRSAQGLGVPAILMTGAARREEIARAVNLGARFVLVKPFAAPDLVGLIREAAAENTARWRAKQLAGRLLVVLFWGCLASGVALGPLILKRLGKRLHAGKHRGDLVVPKARDRRHDLS